MFQVVHVFRFYVSGCAYVLGLCFRLGFCFGHGFHFCFRLGLCSSCDFSAFFFCSSSLVLMGTTGLWLYSDFYGFDGGCGYVSVVK